MCRNLGHLKVVEIADTSVGHKDAQEEFARFADLGIGSALIIGFTVRGETAGYLALANERPLESSDANLHLLMKLIGTSLASGLERMRSVDLLDEFEERNELVSLTANDGIWDFDGQSKHLSLSRRWKDMLGLRCRAGRCPA